MKAIEAILVVLGLTAQAARAETGEEASKETAHSIDGALRASSVTIAAADPSQFGRGLTLILAVTINGMDQGLAQFQMRDGKLWAAPATLVHLGLRLDRMPENEAELILLSDVVGEGLSYDPAMQSVSLMVEVAKLAVGTSVLNRVDEAQPIASSATGMLLNYDVYGNIANGRVSFDGFTELRVFSGNALFDNTALIRSYQTEAGWVQDAVRLDTGVGFSIPERRLSIRVGDTLTRSTSWSRPTRIGGLRIGTDFALQPYLVTAPIPSFFGEATLPSTVDLYIDGVKRYSGEIAPGPFELGSGPNWISGAGQAQVVVTDALGQITTLDFPIYDTPLLLRRGLTDWSLEIGAVREDYGLETSGYASDPVASASWRRGIADTLTVEMHSELGRSVFNVGLGAAWLLPIGGVASASLASSRAEGRSGNRVEIGYEWNDSRFHLAATVQRASDGYADLASEYGTPVTVERDLLTAGYNTDKLGTFSAGVLRQRYQGGSRNSFANLNWYKSLGDRFTLGISSNANLEDRSERSIFLTLSFTPNRRDHLSLSGRATEAKQTASLSYRRSVPLSGGTGWALDAAVGDDGFQSAAQVDHLGPHGQATVGGRQVNGYQAAYAGFSGALVWMGDDVFISRKIFDGFAVVSTDGIEGVPVKLENREVGSTNVSGELLVTGLNAYQSNLLSIETSSLPADLTVGKLQEEAVPARMAGLKIHFPIAPTSSVLMRVIDDQGRDLPVGTGAHYATGQSERFVVGFDGQLFIENAIAGSDLIFETEGGKCGIALPLELHSDRAGRLGTTVCERMP